MFYLSKGCGVRLGKAFVSAGRVGTAVGANGDVPDASALQSHSYSGLVDTRHF